MRISRLFACLPCATGLVACGMTTPAWASASPGMAVAPQAIAADTWVTTDDYPPAALRARIEGVVTARLSIAASGTVNGCTVTASSGSRDLDDVTCQLMLRRARFEPARDGSGEAIAAESTRRVRWQVPRDAPDADEDAADGDELLLFASKPFSADVDFDVTATGTIEHCRATSKLNPFGEAPQCEELNGRTLPAAAGAPQGARHVTIHLSSTSTPLGARPRAPGNGTPPN